MLHGLAHGVRAQVALHAGDAATGAQHLAAMRSWFEGTRNPALFALTMRLEERLRGPARVRPSTERKSLEDGDFETDIVPGS